MSKIIFLNGCGSSGKTTLAKHIQDESPDPWLRVGVDLFIEMLPPRYIALGDRASDGYFEFVSGANAQGPSTSVHITSRGESVFSVSPLLAELLAYKGHNLIIDEVLLDNKTLKGYVSALRDHTVYFIGVFCELSLLQKREKDRGDRVLGLSNDQFHKVHQGVRVYDLTLDTSCVYPEQAVAQIFQFIKDTPEPQGFNKMRLMAQW